MSLSVELTHATALFTGVAEGDLGRTVGEPSDLVRANRGALLELVGVRCITARQQVHGATVATARDGSGYLVGVAEADSVVTATPGVAPAVHVATACRSSSPAPAGSVRSTPAGAASQRGLSRPAYGR
jgi:copper oxidase (laccase) domain-containing protein